MLLRNVENDDDEGNPEPVRCIGDFFSRLQIKRKHRLIEKKIGRKGGGGEKRNLIRQFWHLFDQDQKPEKNSKNSGWIRAKLLSAHLWNNPVILIR